MTAETVGATPPINSAPKRPSLRDLMPVAVPIRVGGQEHQVQPMTWEQAAQVLENLAPLMAQMPALGGGSLRAQDVLPLLAVNRDAVLDFCVIAGGFSDADVLSLSPAHLVELLLGLVEVNIDFFVQSLQPMVQGMQARLAALGAKVAPVAAQISGSTTLSSG
jgi:hypothetical protein